MKIIYQLSHQSGKVLFFESNPLKSYSVVQLARLLDLPVNDDSMLDINFRDWYISQHNSQQWKNLLVSSKWFDQEFFKWLKKYVSIADLCAKENIIVTREKLYV